MITRKTAVSYLSDATRACPIPLSPERFRRKDRAPHDFLFFGHVPVRSYKHGGQWQFMPQDVLEAGRAVAELPWNFEDLVPLGYREQETRGSGHPGWRTELRRVVAGVGADDDCGCPRPPAAAAQQPLHTAADCVLRRYLDYSIACTLPVRALVRAGGNWMIPRTLALVLDRRDERESSLYAVGQPCEGCGSVGPDDSWRSPTAAGWKILCPDCAAAGLRRYRRELQGVPYARVRENGPGPVGFLCAMCETARPATDWDHCHDHGLVRGPLCGRCNSLEGRGKEFLARPGSVPYLLRCDGCRTRRSLPPHHRLAALRRHLHLTWGAQGCDWPMHVHVSLEETDEGYAFTIHCSGPRHRTRTVRGARLTHGEAEQILLDAFEEGVAQET
ncbi:endonuclease domain-containing protein [Streptomyces sp. NPDC090119]|uniref:endonuclease domain-containing protein n=1 Tax=Streptomyces sp. NPDC090119 TaxID=3365951 RepID=UPI00380A8199